MQPVMEGSYPEVLFDIDEADRPPVEAGDMETICQPIDFLGVNFYTRLHYSAPKYIRDGYRHPLLSENLTWQFHKETNF